MAFLLVPKRFTAQPKYAAPIDRQGLGKGVQILFNPAVGPVDLATGRQWAVGGNTSVVISQHGKAFNFDGVDDDLEYTGYPELTGNIGTFFMWAPVVGPADRFGQIFFASSSPAAVYFQVADTNAVYIAGQGSTGIISSWFSSTNRSLVLASGGTAATLKAYLDGVDTGLTWSGTPTAWGSGNKTLGLGKYTGGVDWDFAGTMLIAGWTSQTWGAAEAKAFHDSKGLALFKAPSRKLWAVSASGINLVGAASTQANTGGTGTISQTHILVGPNSSQANPASTGAVTQTHILAGANSSQANASSTGSIAGGANLTVASCVQANPASTGAIGQVHALTITASTQINPSTAIAVTQVHILTGANSAQGNLGGTGAISLSTGNLVGAPSTQINLGGTGFISMVGIVPDAFLASMTVSTAIKKPGVPTGTPDWLKTIIEIVLGRRGNKITIPAEQTLTFSATPTKAECEALYQYTNTVRTAVSDLINRLDS